MSTPEHAELLFDLLRWDEPRTSRAGLAGLTPEVWVGLAELAATQQVAPLLYHKLGARGMLELAPAPTAERLAASYQANALRTMQIYRQLAEIAGIAAERAIPLVALKGVALAGPVYGNIALRPMGDIDLLAPAGQAEELYAALLEAGYKPIDAAGLGAHLPQHLPTLGRAGSVCPVELHWRLGTAEDHYHIPLDEIWASPGPLELPGCRLLGLGAEELLLYLCIHATYHHELIGVGARPLCDLAQLLSVRGAELDWASLSERAGRWRCERGVALALRLAHELVGAPVPPAALEQCGAAELPAPLLAASRVQLFSAYAESAAMPAALADLAASEGPVARAGALWRRIFVSREALGRQFGVSPRDPRIWGYYPLRLAALLRRHSGAAAALLRGDEEAGRRAERRLTIGGWLAGQ